MKYFPYIAMVIFVALAGLALNISSKTQTIPPTSSTQTALTPSKQSASTSSRYMAYSKEAFAEAKNKKRILYFHADWCPTCRPLDQEITNSTDQIPDGVVIFKTDFDKEKELKKQYAVPYQHVFVQVDNNGNEIAKWSGGRLSDILNNIR